MSEQNETRQTPQPPSQSSDELAAMLPPAEPPPPDDLVEQILALDPLQLVREHFALLVRRLRAERPVFEAKQKAPASAIKLHPPASSPATSPGTTSRSRTKKPKMSEEEKK